jgi:hypothetical protein
MTQGNGGESGMNMTNMARRIAFPVVVFAVLFSLPAQSAVTIGAGATQDMACVAGICTATAANAVLNVNDLQTMLASSSVKVATGAAGNNIVVGTGLTWISTNTLTLDARRSVVVNKPISVAGSGSLAVLTNDGSSGGALSFGQQGKITFWSVSDTLTINGVTYTLVNDLATLAADIAAQSNGNFALANDYDAGHDGTHKSTPIPTPFNGTFDGLGNAILNLTIRDNADVNVGFFAQVASGGAILHFGLKAAKIIDVNTAANNVVGGLASENDGQIISCFMHGSVKMFLNLSDYNLVAGGLVGLNNGTISNSYMDGTVVGADGADIGGLVGWQKSGSITASHSIGSVSSLTGGSGGAIGGLVGENFAAISNSYSTSTVVGAPHSLTGGLVGDDFGTGGTGSITDSFATGNVSAGAQADAGGLVGYSVSDTIENTYATGAVTGGGNRYAGVGGLVGVGTDSATISTGYSTGLVTSKQGINTGGAIGDSNTGFVGILYWDTTTSGITYPSKGCGNNNIPCHVVGLTTTQFQSGLPPGFNPAIWAENPGINGGLPYLITNPPT